LKNAFIVFIGGGIGAVFRYWMYGVAGKLIGADFPYGTLIVNIFGCFMIGFLMSVFEERFIVQPALRIFLTIGILGGFTTFSTFSFETVALLQEGSYFFGVVNIVVTFVGTLTVAWFGLVIGKLI
jgi:CrcB protein